MGKDSMRTVIVEFVCWHTLDQKKASPNSEKPSFGPWRIRVHGEHEAERKYQCCAAGGVASTILSRLVSD